MHFFCKFSSDNVQTEHDDPLRASLQSDELHGWNVSLFPLANCIIMTDRNAMGSESSVSLLLTWLRALTYLLCQLFVSVSVSLSFCLWFSLCFCFRSSHAVMQLCLCSLSQSHLSHFVRNKWHGVFICMKLCSRILMLMWYVQDYLWSICCLKWGSKGIV